MRRVDITDIGRDQDNYAFHLARYLFAGRQIKSNEKVLEVGCGTGYGARYLSDLAKSIVAWDSDDQVQLNWNQFSKAPNLEFRQPDLNEIFDVVISYEVVEHIALEDLDSYFKGLRSAMHANSKLFISTPRAIPFEKRSHNRQLHHVYEYSFVEFRYLLEQHFGVVLIFSQNDMLIGTQNPETAWNFVAICSNGLD